VSGQLHVAVTLHLGKMTPGLIQWESLGASASVWMLWQKRKSLATAENEAMMLQLFSL